jgi:hypothetical protein
MMRYSVISNGKLPVLFFIVALALILVLAPAPAVLALTEEETKRAEALIPLLDGEQEFWAIGEFVHIGPPAIPVLAKGVRHPSRRVRLNAIETMFMIQDKAAVPVLNAVAANAEEIPAVREKALRVAIRLDPAHAVPALEAMAKDPSETIRNAVVSESRFVKDKAVIDLLITLLADNSRSVADGAFRTLWNFTGRMVEGQDFIQSTKEERVAWAKDWMRWWADTRDKFQFTPDRPPGPPPIVIPPGGFPMPPTDKPIQPPSQEFGY